MTLQEALSFADHLSRVHGREVWGAVNGLAMLRERKLSAPGFMFPADCWLLMQIKPSGRKTPIGLHADKPLMSVVFPIMNVRDTQLVNPRTLRLADEYEDELQFHASCNCLNWRRAA